MHEYFNTHPILPFTVIFFNSTAYIPVVFLIVVVQKTPLHSNCKYLFTAWLCGYAVLFTINILMALVALKDEHGYLTQSIRSPPQREILYGLCSSCSFYCSMSEIALAVERIIATANPEIYHTTKLAMSVLIPLTIFLIDFTFLIGRLAYQWNEFEIAGTFLLFCDIMTIVTNALSVKYNRQRFQEAFDNLNAKYQAKEAFQLSSAMQPIYIVIFCMKFVIVISSIICLGMNDPFFNGYNEAFYTTFTAIYASIVAIMLIKKHPQLLKQARLILGIRISVAPLPPRNVCYTQDHFKSLESYWN